MVLSSSQPCGIRVIYRCRHGSRTGLRKIFSPRDRVPDFFLVPGTFPNSWVPEFRVPTIWVPVPVLDPGFKNVESRSQSRISQISNLIPGHSPGFYFESRFPSQTGFIRNVLSSFVWRFVCVVETQSLWQLLRLSQKNWWKFWYVRSQFPRLIVTTRKNKPTRIY